LNELANQKGSVQDILKALGSPAIPSTLLQRKLTEQEIENNIKLKRPFVILAYQHFIVGYGLTNGHLYYMDPWEGEGYGYNKYGDKVGDKVWYWTLTMNRGRYVPLVNGDVKNNLSAPAGEYRYFEIEVPAGASDLSITVLGGNGVPNILARRATEPSTSQSSECSATVQRLRFKGKRCLIEDTRKGTYYIKVGGTNFSDATLYVSYTAPQSDTASSR
jgi:hypothetical protein